MKPLVCDICGGDLVVQAGGEKAVCSCCAIQYSLERIREKVLEIRGTVRVEGTVQTNQTGSREDVDQWRKLLEKYYAAGDFQSANQIVKKILEAIPNDPQANQMYDDLQVLRDLEVNNGILVKYHGSAASITIPSCVKIIGKESFKECEFLQHVVVADTVEEIQAEAFSGCTNLQTIVLPDSVKSIGSHAFSRCTSLVNISIPETVESIEGDTFSNCTSLTNASIPESVRFIGQKTFYGCTSLINVSIPDSFVTYKVFEERDYDDDSYRDRYSSPWYLKRREIEYRRYYNKCQYCGGEFSSWTGKCKKCGRRKDY